MRVPARRFNPLRHGATTWVVASGVLLATPSCLQNHDVFADRGPGDPTGRGGAVGSWVPPDAAAEAGEDAAPAEDGAAPVILDLPWRLSVVHGVTDSPWIALCFARVRDGVEELATPAKPPALGLSFGGVATLERIPGIDLGKDGIHAYVVAASDARAVEGLDCSTLIALSRTEPPLPPPAPVFSDASAIVRDAAPPVDASSTPQDASLATEASRDAAPDVSGDATRGAARDARAPPSDASPSIPGVRVAALPVVPPGQLATPHGYLLVVSGCLGGPGVTDPSATSLCGDGYAPDAPTLSPIVVALSRSAPKDRVALGFLEASPAFSHCDVRLTPSRKGDHIPVATDVAVGALRPRPPNTKSASLDIGASGPGASIQLHPGGSTDIVYDEPWATTLAAGGITDLVDGRAYTLVFVGPYPTFSKRRWWNGPLVTVVEN